jgi:hypothetical protein
MSKPILWLGPLEELDADFDPLLGRSAKQAETAASAASMRATLDPSRSVFDDPVSNEAPPMLVQKEIAPAHTDSPVSEFADEPAVLLALEAETVVEPVLTDPANAEPQEDELLPLAIEPNLEVALETDYSHNNDPIPTRQELSVSEPDVSGQLQPLDEDVKTTASPPKKSFFASLFSLSPNPPEPVIERPSTNDIWAKSADEHQAEAATDKVSLRGRDVWAEIDSDASNDVAQSDFIVETVSAEEPVTSQEMSDELPLKDSKFELVDEPVQPDDAEVLSDDLEIVEQNLSLPEVRQEITTEMLDAAPEVVEPSIAADAETVAPLEAEKEHDIAPDTTVHVVPLDPLETSQPPENPASIAFQNAFNADQFWALPKGTNQPHPELDDHDQGDYVDNSLDTPEGADPLFEPAPQLIETAKAEPNDEAVATQESMPLSQDESVLAAPVVKPRPSAAGKRRKKKSKKTYIAAFFGTLIFGVAFLMTLVSSLAAFGYPFDLMSSYRWYWVIMTVVAAGIWGLSRGWKMVAASFAVMAANLFVTVPASGEAPSGGKTATAVVGWANVAGNSDALVRVFKDADKRKAALLMVAEAPQGVFTPPQGWTLIEAPVAGDPTAIAVLTKSTWRAATVPGEPTMARPPAGDLTVIGVHPQDAVKTRRRTPNRDALINRAGTRAGIQEGPTIVLGDFNTAPWDKAMNQFRNYGNVTRVRCGGWAGTTLTQAFGLIGVATDHAYVRDVKVTHCVLGGSMTGGNHKPIWLYVAPQPAAPPIAPKS